jgi:fatty-acyl-CoA synthase
VPKRVLAVDAIPMTALGKPDKKALRAAYGG